jgi:hypothetical protein
MRILHASNEAKMPGQQAPDRISPKSLADYLEVMGKAIFQAGMSWRVVEAKWQGIREAFRGFEPEAVASLSPDELDQPTRDPRLIRNRRKIEAMVSNADRILKLESQHGSFKSYLRSYPDFSAAQAGLGKDFKFLGPFGAYYFLYVVGEEVPSHEEWMASRPNRRH